LSEEALPEPVILLLLDVIQSVEHLEVLLLLASTATRSWTADAVARELRGSPRSAARWLADLVTRGFAAAATDAPDAFRYAPATPALAAQVEATAACYAVRRVAVIETIFAKPVARMQTFARAFRLREDR
jgi:hypothetical protein